MTVESIMKTNIFTVNMDDTIGDIHEILKKAEFHHLLVVENRKLVGIISDRDTLKTISPFIGKLSEQERDVNILHKKVHQIMSRELITIKKNTIIEKAGYLLLKNKISCLPVIDSNGILEGIVTWKDILEFYLENKNK